MFKLGKTFMVFPYMEHDLAGLLENPSVNLTEAMIKQYSKQLLLGTAYLHQVRRSPSSRNDSDLMHLSTSRTASSTAT